MLVDEQEMSQIAADGAEQEGEPGDAATPRSARWIKRERARQRAAAQAETLAPLRPETMGAVDLDLHGAAFGGRMVGRLEGRVVFVAGGQPGERVRVRLTAARKSYAEATALAVLQPGERADPPCPYFGENGTRRGAVPLLTESKGAAQYDGVCGGCQYQHIRYDAQLHHKQRIVADLLRRVGRLSEPEVGLTLASPAPWAYRTKARWTVDPQGHVAYRRAGGREAVAVEACYIVAPPLAAALHRLAQDDLAAALRGRVAEITARCLPDADDPTVQRVVLVLHPQPGLPDEDAPAGSGVDEGEPVEPVVLTPQEALIQPVALDEPHPLADLAAVLGEACGLWGVAAAPDRVGGRATTMWGQGALRTRFAGILYHLSPLTFFQVNPSAAELLLSQIRAGLGDLSGQTLLDVYSGAGAFALPLSSAAAEVLAIEADPQAVEDARASAELNGIRNVTLMPGAAAARLREITKGMADAAVLDPPRSGCGLDVLDELGRLALRRVVYVSCDPATLARDLGLLEARGYQTLSVYPVDLFPQTASIEVVATLGRRDTLTPTTPTDADQA